MYNLFNDDTHPYSGDINISMLSFVKTNLARELNRVIDYYRNSVHTVYSNHFLMKLINNLPLSMHDEPEVYHNRIADLTDDLTRVLKYTSSIFRGTVFDGNIYGDGTQEIYISVIEEYEKYKDIPWQDLKPIRVISHPRTALLFDPIKNKAFENEVGLAVFTIDVPMLMIQYRSWAKDPSSNISEDDHLGALQFLAMYPLPNILYSHLEVAIFNRLTQWKYGIVPNDALPRFPVAINNYSGQLDKILIDLNGLFDRHKKDFYGVLDNIPTVFHKGYLDVIHFPPMAVTRNVKWAMVLSRLPIMKYLLKQSYDANVDRNLNTRNEILRQLRELRNDRAIEQMLSPQLFKSIKHTIDYDIIAIAK